MTAQVRHLTRLNSVYFKIAKMSCDVLLHIIGTCTGAQIASSCHAATRMCVTSMHKAQTAFTLEWMYVCRLRYSSVGITDMEPLKH